MTTLDNRSPWSRKKVEGPLQPLDVHVFIDRNFATQFLAERMERDVSPMRSRRDKIGKRLDAAMQNGLIPFNGRKFKFGYLVAWALRTKDLANTVSGLPGIGHANADLAAPSFQLNSWGYSIPETLDACQSALVDASRELNQLREDRLSLLATINELLPYKVKAMEKSFKTRKAGQAGGRPPNK